MIDTSFLVTLLIIMVGALIGSYLRSASKDRCLKDFDDYHVTVEKKDGHIIWGDMHLESTGMELEYAIDVQDQAHIETCYVLYKNEYKDLQGIYRYADELTPEERRSREKDLRRSFHPGPARVLARKLQNFLIRATDSLAEAMPLLTGQVKKPAGRYIAAPEEVYLQKLGKNIIGYVGTNFDPLLENYIGAKVVVEVLEGSESREYVGVLKEYSADFLEVLDLFYPQLHSVNLSSTEAQKKLEKDVRIAFEESFFKIQNLTGYPLLLHRIRHGDRQGEVNAVIGPGDELRVQPLALTESRTLDQAELSIFFEGLTRHEEAEVAQLAKNATDLAHVLEGLHWEDIAKENVEFDFKVIRLLDMVVPRDHALIRHKAERYDPNQVFGEMILRWGSRRQEKGLEAAYREALAKRPHDVVSATGLSQLLLRQGQFEEAEKWLDLALQHRDKLVDGGRVVELQLQMVRRKLAGQSQSK